MKKATQRTIDLRVIRKQLRYLADASEFLLSEFLLFACSIMADDEEEEIPAAASDAQKKKKKKKKKKKGEQKQEGADGDTSSQAAADRSKASAEPAADSKGSTQAAAAAATADTVESATKTMAASSLDPATQKELFEKMFNLKGKKKEKKEKHNFWDTQLVPAHGTTFATENGPIEIKTVDQVPEEPYKLPASFKWVVCDMNNADERKEVYELLSLNYVEDDDNMFRFDYSSEFLQWALQPPGYLPELHLGVRGTSGKQRLVGFITGIPAEVMVHGKKVSMVEINFLCVHKKLRDKRLAPVLIMEVTRRVNKTGVWQAVYTAGVVLPKPVGRN
eukprot:g40497.t1